MHQKQQLEITFWWFYLNHLIFDVYLNNQQRNDARPR